MQWGAAVCRGERKGHGGGGVRHIRRQAGGERRQQGGGGMQKGGRDQAAVGSMREVKTTCLDLLTGGEGF